jgi:hypothetical protein
MLIVPRQVVGPGDLRAGFTCWVAAAGTESTPDNMDR